MTNVNYNLVTCYKSLMKISLIAIICSIFIIPFGYFSLSIYLSNRNDLNKEVLSSLLLVLMILIFDLIFYIYLEIYFIYKIFKNNIPNKKILILGFFNFIFTFVTFSILIIVLFREISNVMGVEFRFRFLRRKNRDNK